VNTEVNRRTLVLGLGAVAGVAFLGGCSSGSRPSPSGPGAPSPLVFGGNAGVQTTTITTDAGPKVVTYRFYGPVTYVANPVDEVYQSLVVSVPMSIDGKDVDAANAPIVFVNSVGGYLPATVKDAKGVGEAGMQSVGNAMLDGGGKMVNLAQLALAAGYVAVEPGCRGRSLVDAGGTYYGTAPAAVVDLKAAIRYLRFNKGRIPGNTDQIISTGTSAGGALSALLGASGDSPRFSRYLDDVGAANTSDAVFVSADWCPITDLEHADAAYEWNWGTNATQNPGGQVDQALSGELRAQFAQYQAALNMNGRNAFGPLTVDTYRDYLLREYLQPSAARYLAALPDAERSAYLAANPFIEWADGKAGFDWAGYLAHVGPRKKAVPAFDAFDLSAAENNEFGGGSTKARHFTQFGVDHDTTGLKSHRLDDDSSELVDLMNPMYFLGQSNPNHAPHWWIRLGTKDTDTALTVSANLAAKLDALGADVNHLMYWDEGHGANTDVAEFIAWIRHMTDYQG
jgi:acetyl esterase/lipase